MENIPLSQSDQYKFPPGNEMEIRKLEGIGSTKIHTYNMYILKFKSNVFSFKDTKCALIQ